MQRIWVNVANYIAHSKSDERASIIGGNYQRSISIENLFLSFFAFRDVLVLPYPFFLCTH